MALISRGRRFRTIEIRYYQRQLANQVIEQMNELIALITSSLNIHLNIGQDLSVETSQALMFLETKTARITFEFIRQACGKWTDPTSVEHRYHFE